jgi:hypothetical protein
MNNIEFSKTMVVIYFYHIEKSAIVDIMNKLSIRHQDIIDIIGTENLREIDKPNKENEQRKKRNLLKIRILSMYHNEGNTIDEIHNNYNELFTKDEIIDIVTL